MDLEKALRELFASHGLNCEFSKKYTVKNELTTVFSTERNSYWSVIATIPPTWVTPAEHDALFFEATKVALEKWLKERMTKSRNDQIKDLVEKITEIAPYGPTSAEFIAEAIDLECTGEDDHDLENCDKCHRIRRRIVVALRSGYWQQTSQLAVVVDKAKVPGAVGLDGRSPAFDLHKANETLVEVDRILSWMKA